MKYKNHLAAYVGHGYALCYNVSAEAWIFPNDIIRSTVKNDYKPMSPI